jgi:hypothetical protein
LARSLDAIDSIEVVMQGGAGGADRLAVKWAETRSVPVVTFPANWRSGRKAGPLRNSFMLSFGKPDLVVAFPGGVGTADIVAKASAADVRVVQVQA